MPTIGQLFVDVLPNTSGFHRAVERATQNLVVKVEAELDTASLARVKSQIKDISGKAKVTVDVDSGGIRKLQADINAIRPTIKAKVDVDTSQVRSASNDVSRLGASGAGLGSLARLGMTAAGAMVAVKGAALTAAPALIGMASSAGVASAALVAVAPAAIGAAMALGGVVVAFSGVMSALKQADTLDDQVTQGSARRASSRISNAIAIRGAVEGIRDAELGVGEAQRAVRPAQEALTSAQERAKDAQEGLNRARQEALRDIQDLKEQISDLALSEEGASIALERARERAAKIGKDPKSSALDRRESLLDIKEAEDRLNDVQSERSRTTKSLAEAEKKGVDGSKKVVAAQRDHREALNGVRDAQGGVENAYRGVAKAQANVARAVRNLSDIQIQQADAAKDQAAAMQKVNPAAERLNRILNEMSPAGRKMFYTLRDLKDASKEWRSEIESKTLPGFISFLEDVQEKGRGGKSTIDLIVGGMASLGGIVGETTAKLGEYAKSPAFQKNLNTITDNNKTAFKNLGDAVVAITPALTTIFAAASPLVVRFSEYIEKIALRFAAWIEGVDQNGKLSAFFKTAGDELSKWWSIAINLGQILIGVLSAAFPTGSGITKRLQEITGEIANWASSSDGQQKMKDFFEWVKNLPWAAIGNGLLGVAGGLIALKGATAAFTAIQGVVGVVGGLLSLGPVGWVLLGIAAAVTALAGTFAYLYSSSEPFRAWIHEKLLPALSALWGWVKEKLWPALQELGQNIWLYVAPALNYLRQMWNENKDEIILWWNSFKPVIDWVVANVVPLFGHVLGTAIAQPIIALGSLIGVFGFLVRAGIKLGTFISVDLPGYFASGVNFIKQRWDVLKGNVKAVWDWLLTRVWSPIRTFMTATIPGWFGSGVNLIKSAWDRVQGFIKAPYDWIKKTVFDPLMTMIKTTIPNAFDKGVGFIKSFWDKVKAIASAPVKFIVNTVYNDGIRAFWNNIASKVNLPELPKLAVKGLARGGQLPGNSGMQYRDDRLATSPRGPIALAGGEYVVNAPQTRKNLPLLQAINSGHGFAQGGFIGKGLSYLGGKAKGIWEDVKNAGRGFIHGVASRALSPLSGLIDKNMPAGAAGNLIGSAAKKPMTSFLDWIKGDDTKYSAQMASMVDGSGGGTYQQIAYSVGKAMRANNKAMLAMFETATVESNWKNYANRNVPESMNIPHDAVGSDHRSVGIMQQQTPGWGSARELMTPAIAFRKFLNVAIPRSNRSGTAGQLAQSVQVSAFPSRYDAAEKRAQAMLNNAAAMGSGGGGNAGSFSPGYANQLSVLNKAGFNLKFARSQLNAGGHSPTSWHYKGRAVDIGVGTNGLGTVEKVWKFLVGNYAKSSKELYWASKSTNYKNGEPVGPRDKTNHIHWAYDQGGWLEKGSTLTKNATGKPEAVLTAEQWQDMHTLAQAMLAGGTNNNGPAVIMHNTIQSQEDAYSLMQAAEFMVNSGRIR